MSGIRTKSPDEIDAMSPDEYTAELRASIERGIEDARAGRLHTTEDVLNALTERRRERARRVG